MSGSSKDRRRAARARTNLATTIASAVVERLNKGRSTPPSATPALERTPPKWRTVLQGLSVPLGLVLPFFTARGIEVNAYLALGILAALCVSLLDWVWSHTASTLGRVTGSLVAIGLCLALLTLADVGSSDNWLRVPYRTTAELQLPVTRGQGCAGCATEIHLDGAGTLFLVEGNRDYVELSLTEEPIYETTGTGAGSIDLPGKGQPLTPNGDGPSIRTDTITPGLQQPGTRLEIKRYSNTQGPFRFYSYGVATFHNLIVSGRTFRVTLVSVREDRAGRQARFHYSFNIAEQFAPSQQGRPADAAEVATPATTTVPATPAQGIPGATAGAPDVEAQGDRVYVERTLPQLVAMVDGLTSLEAERLTAPMIGKWLRVRGLVYDVSETISAPGGLTVRVDDAGGGFTHVAFCRFPAANSRQVSHLRRGDRAHVAGLIRGITDSGINLGSCEIAAD